VGMCCPDIPLINLAALFSSLYQGNLLQNTAFLERENTLKGDGLIESQKACMGETWRWALAS